MYVEQRISQNIKHDLVGALWVCILGRFMLAK